MRINLIGRGPGWQEAPHCGEVGLCFGLNSHILKRNFDVIFDMHDLENRLAGESETGWNMRSNETIQAGLDRAKEIDCTVFTVKDYPIEKIVSKFNTNLFASGFDFMIAYALSLDPDIIDVYGCPMMHSTEYAHQKHSAAYWVGRAEERTEFNDKSVNSEILKIRKRYVYGYNIKQSKFMTEWLNNPQKEK